MVDFFKTATKEFLGDGIPATGFQPRIQHQISSEIHRNRGRFRAEKNVLDFQDILQRLAFDNVCKIVFGYDPAYLSPSRSEEKFAVAFEKAAKLSTYRFRSFIPRFWKIKRALNFGSEKQLVDLSRYCAGSCR
ncbi:hypothetical protein ACS0TY_035728 [Phlomoides rotata]